MQRTPARARATLVVVIALSLLAASCGRAGNAESSTTSSPASTTTSTGVVSTSTTRSPTTTSTAPASTTTTLAGEPLDFGPNPGDVLGVVAVAFDDVLNVRAGPGTDYEVLKKLAARSDRVVSNGRARSLPNSIWYEVTAAGVTGWASATYLAYLGATDDITAQITVALGETPSAPTMESLGEVVSSTFPSDERRLRVRMSGAPSVGDLGEVIYDVVGFADDSVRGLRLHIFGQSEDGEFTLKSVEATSLCARGVTSEGLCV